MHSRAARIIDIDGVNVTHQSPRPKLGASAMQPLPTLIILKGIDRQALEIPDCVGDKLAGSLPAVDGLSLATVTSVPGRETRCRSGALRHRWWLCERFQQRIARHMGRDRCD